MLAELTAALVVAEADLAEARRRVPLDLLEHVERAARHAEAELTGGR
jgi:hypothetical protein